MMPGTNYISASTGSREVQNTENTNQEGWGITLWLHNNVNEFNATELYTLKWLQWSILYYV